MRKLKLREANTINLVTKSKSLKAFGLLTAFTIPAILSCTHSLNLKTEPAGAQVFALDGQGNRGALLGQTPFRIEQPNLNRLYFLEVAQVGYDTRQVLAPALTTGSQEISMQLKPMNREFFQEQFKKEESQFLNKGMGQLLTLQAAVIAKKSDRVLEIEQSLSAKFDQVSIFHSLMATHFYFQGNVTEAKKRSRRALDLDPTNSESAGLLRLLGGAVPKNSIQNPKDAVTK